MLATHNQIRFCSAICVNDNFLTLLTEPPPIAHFAEMLATASFKVFEVPGSLDGGVFHVECGICGHLMRAGLHRVDSAADRTGKELVEAAMCEVAKVPYDLNVKSVVVHLQQTRFVIYTSEPFLPECDCEFRFHQVMGSGNYLWYVVGQGFADELEVWLEFEPGDS